MYNKIYVSSDREMNFLTIRAICKCLQGVSQLGMPPEIADGFVEFAIQNKENAHGKNFIHILTALFYSNHNIQSPGSCVGSC